MLMLSTVSLFFANFARTGLPQMMFCPHDFKHFGSVLHLSFSPENTLSATFQKNVSVSVDRRATVLWLF